MGGAPPLLAALLSWCPPSDQFVLEFVAEFVAEELISDDISLLLLLLRGVQSRRFVLVLLLT